MAQIPDVSLAQPHDKPLCSPAFFALMLSTLRRRFPRVHYTFPTFATFCRGEKIEGENLQLLRQELEQILEGLKDLTPSDRVRLREDFSPEDPEIYRHAHYRGRTFDRTRICETQADPGEPPPYEVYRHVILDILNAADIALKQESVLVQAPRSYHKPLRASENI